MKDLLQHIQAQQAALAIQQEAYANANAQAAQANTGEQPAVGAEDFGGGLKDGAARTDQLSLSQLSLSTGPLRLFLPPQLATAGANPNLATGVDIPADPIVYSPSEAPPTAPHASAATGALSYGRELVYSQPATQTSPLPQSLIPSRAGDSPSASAARRLEPEASPQASRHTGLPASRTDAVTVRSPQGVVSLPTASVDRVHQLLTHLQLLPPGARTEDVLPRLQEIVRLWNQETARHSDLPPNVIRAVNHFLASAVLSIRSPLAIGSPSDAVDAKPVGSLESGPAGFGRSPETPSRGIGSSFARPIPPSIARIAEAVVNLLSGAHLQAAPAPLQVRPQAQPLPQQAHRPPSMGPAGNPLGTSGVHAEGTPLAIRPEALVRPETLVRPQTREDVRQPRLMFSPEAERIEREGERHPQVVIEPSYEREPQRGPAYASETTLDALWPDLHQDLRANGFLDDRNGSIRILRSADEGRTLLAVVADRVPAGFDPIDLLELIGHKIGWSGKGGPVNDAFARLASYRKIGDGTKAGALLEPLRDAIVILDLGGDILSEEEAHVLRRYEAHSPVAELFLENESWFARLENRKENSRQTLEADLEESHVLYEDYLASQNGMRRRLENPPAPRLLN